jgi:integral membrane protein
VVIGHAPGTGQRAWHRRVVEPSLDGALLRYRVMAYVVGTLLLVLCGVAVPLQYVAGHPGPASVIGVIHGMAYIVYLAASYDLGRRAHWKLRRLVPPVFAGFVPILAFVVERRTTRRVLEEQSQTLDVVPVEMQPPD